ncbi:cAMP phosphodiesterases class-II-domain-containing protein [Lactarius hengduanensis]|nr:cAMP phosphodiesterases class-II-domain-containing protein [Lactarius hengduanensis]
MPPTFDLVVVGSGGGPFETNLSSYLFKPCDVPWADGIIALEAGSGIGALYHLINRNVALFDGLSAHQVYSLIHCFLISHAHLDHVVGLVLSAGALHGCRKRVCAPRSVLKILETVFSDRIWPNLASWDEDDAPFKLLYNPFNFDEAYRTVFRDSVSVRAMPLLHGQNDTLGDYESSAFFVRHDPSGKQFLFFGDVAPDSLAARPQTIAVWRAAAPLIPHALSTVFIECSWPSGRPDEQLYGHLSPEHLVDELVALAAEVAAVRLAETAAEGPADGADAPPPPPPPEQKGRRRRRKRRRKLSADPPPPPLGPLAGLRVYIIHCKEDLEGKYDDPISEVIRDQVDALVRAKGLGAEVLSADQGMTISTS